MPSVFFSYCHADEALRNELQKHLTLMVRTGAIETWHDRMIRAGDEVDGEIDKHLEEAEVILLLISSDFLASNYCYDIEVKRAMQRHKGGSARVIPIILRPCDWHGAPFGKLLAAPIDGKPVTKWPNQDEAFLNITQQIRAALPENPIKQSPLPHVTTSSSGQTMPQSRSSNLSVIKEFSEADRDRFMEESFEFLGKFFEGSLEELDARYPEIETAFKQVDSNCFTAKIYRHGRTISKCSICLGRSGIGNGITYSSDDTSRGNSFNDMLSLHAGEQSLSLKTMLTMSQRLGPKNYALSQEGAAEHFWSKLIQALQ